jgi:hypothetical protein
VLHFLRTGNQCRVEDRPSFEFFLLGRFRMGLGNIAPDRFCMQAGHGPRAQLRWDGDISTVRGSQQETLAHQCLKD